MTYSNNQLIEVPIHFEMANDLWSEIVPNLWQGGTLDKYAPSRWVNNRIKESDQVLKNITLEDFDSVYTFYANAEPADWFVKEIRYPFYDTEMSGALGDVEEELYDIVRMAHKDWVNGKRVLIRCQAGLNRSGLVLGLVLIRAGYSGVEAINLMRSQRSRMCVCNESFEEYLLTVDPDIWRN